MSLHSARLTSLLVGVLALSACAGNGMGAPGRTNPLLPAEPNAPNTRACNLVGESRRRDAGSPLRVKRQGRKRLRLFLPAGQVERMAASTSRPVVYVRTQTAMFLSRKATRY